MPRGVVIVLLASVLIGPGAGCARQRYFPDRASAPYPFELHTTHTVQIQVFREGVNLEVVNATAHTYRDFELWVNQRYHMHVDELPAGSTRRFSLWDFYDERGEVINAGGFFRSYEPTPVRLVEIQPRPGQPLIGLITIRAEDAE
ncbi:MAG: hypothetical protein ACYTGG_06900 [Planctomycetota bacterium]|jgi:hypothetical protein